MTPAQLTPAGALIARARTLGLALQAVGHGLRALGKRIEGIEHRAADLRALAGFLASQRGRQEPAVPAHREAA